MAVQAMGMQIRIPQGDTGSVKFTVSGAEITDEDKGVFTVSSRSGTPILRKVLAPNFSDNAFHLPFTYEDTAALRPDSYSWSMRVVRGATLNDKGRIEDTQGSHTPVLNGRLVILPVAGGAR